MIERSMSRWAAGELSKWALALDQTDELVGTCGFNEWSEVHGWAELAFDLFPAHWGKGLMRQAVARALEGRSNKVTSIACRHSSGSTMRGPRACSSGADSGVRDVSGVTACVAGCPTISSSMAYCTRIGWPPKATFETDAIERTCAGRHLGASIVGQPIRISTPLLASERVAQLS